MWNKKVTIILVCLFLLGIFIISGLILGNEYVGVLIEDNVQTGFLKKDTCTYVAKIDENLDPNSYKDGKMTMGIVLDWNRDEADLDVDVYEIVKERWLLPNIVTKIPRVDWQDGDNLERGSFEVNPEKKYEIKVKARQGGAHFTLKILQPGLVFSSDEKDNSNELGSLVFYHIKGDSSKLHYQKSDGKASKPGFTPDVLVFKGEPDQFLVEKGMSNSLEINELKPTNLIISQKSKIISAHSRYFFYEEDDQLEKIQVKGNFTEKVPLNALQEHRYDIKFPKEAQYILLNVDDEEEKDVKLKVYDKDKDLPVEEGFRLWNNIYVLDLRKFADESKIYELVVEAGSFGTDPFVHYQFSQMVGNQLQEPIVSNFTIRDSDHSILREDSIVTVKWFIFKSNQIGDGKLKIKWFTKNIETENSDDLKTNLHFGIYKYDEQDKTCKTHTYKKVEETDVFSRPESFDVSSTKENEIYFLKVVQFTPTTVAIQAEGLDLYSIDTSEDIAYSKKMLKTISMLYADDILDVNVFEKWYQLHKIGLQRVDIKYTLMTVLLEKFKSGLITWNQFLEYYDELEIKSNLEEYILELYFENIPTKTEPLLSKDEFVKYYDELVYWNNTVEEKFKRILFDKLQSETDPLSYEDFKSCIDKLKYTRLEYEDTEDYLTFADYLAYLDNKNFIDITDELDTLSDQLDKIQIMKSMLKDIKTSDLDLVKLKKVKDYFVENFEGVPSWFAILEDEEDNLTLFSWAAERETTSEDIVAISGSVREKVKILQKILGALGFPCGDDGKYGNDTDNIFEAFKTFHNTYEDGETLEIYVEQPLPGDPNHNESSREKVDFKTLAYMMIDYMAMDKQIAFTALRPDRLTYFSGNEIGKWSGNLDLESVPVVLAEGYVNLRRGVDHSRSQTELTATWELTSLTNNVTKDDKGNYKIYETNAEGKIVNEVVLFKDKKDTTRVRVNWLVESSNPVTVGSLKGTITLPNGTEYVDSYPLVIYPLYVTAYNKNSDQALWDQEAYYYVSNFKKGMEIPYTDLDGITIKKKFVRESVPFHMIQAKMKRESGYKAGQTRYEPFWDSRYFHLNKHGANSIKEMKKMGIDIGIVEEGNTIYQEFSNNRSSYPQSLWHGIASLCYNKLTAKSERLAEQFLELYLDYGEYVAVNWYEKVDYDDLAEAEMQRFYPKNTDQNGQVDWFEENVWKSIKKIIFEEDGISVIDVVVNSDSNANDDFNLHFIKPELTEDDQRWSKKWEASEYEAYFHEVEENGEEVWKVDKSINKSITIIENNKKFRQIIREIATKIQSSTDNKYIIEGTDTEISASEVLKNFLEIYISYKHEKAINWYNSGLNPDKDPRKNLWKPFIAQTKISKSYGPSQIMYLSAWNYGYRKDPNTQGDELAKYKNSIKYGMYILVAQKYTPIPEKNWMENWNKAINNYNGGGRPAYVQEIRNFERYYLPIIKE